MGNAFNRKISNNFDNKSQPPPKNSPKIPLALFWGSSNEPENKDWSVSLGITSSTVGRHSIPVNFIGTKSQQESNPFHSKLRNEYTKKYAEIRALENEKTFNTAIFILSQSSTGRDLLENLNKAGYEIVFDESRTKMIGAGGLCDPTNRQIILGQSSDPDYMALVLGHEAVHAMQYTTNKIFPNSSYTPEAIIQLSFTIEADAYAQQTQIALELAHGDPNGPKNQFKTRKPLNQMRKRFKNIVETAEKTLLKKENLTNGAAVAAAFEGFFDNIVLRSFYEDTHIEWCHNIAAEFSKKTHLLKKNFIKQVNVNDVINSLRHKGRPYLKQHAPNIDLTGARHSGFTTETQVEILDFYKKYKPKAKSPKLQTYGIHIQNAASLMFGRYADTNIVILKNKKISPQAPKM